MLRILCIVLALLLIGCEPTEDKKAEELQKLVDHFHEKGNYEMAIEVLQMIRMDYSDKDIARSAERQIGNYNSLIDLELKNKRRALESTFQSIGISLENYLSRYSVLPLTSHSLNSKLPEAMVPKWEDPWGNPIYYKPTYSDDMIPKHSPDRYVLASFGKDGLPGGSGQDQDFFYQNNKMVESIIMD